MCLWPPVWSTPSACRSWTPALTPSVASMQLILHAAATSIFWKCKSGHAKSQGKRALWLLTAFMTKPCRGPDSLWDPASSLMPPPCLSPLHSSQGGLLLGPRTLTNSLLGGSRLCSCCSFCVQCSSFPTSPSLLPITLHIRSGVTSSKGCP